MNKLFLMLTFLLGLSVYASAQEKSTATEKYKEIAARLKKIPLTGSRPEDFIPEGAQINETAAQGDLNGDGLPDYAFDIVLKNKPDEYTGCADAVIILFAENGGKLRRVGVNDALSGSGFCEKQWVTIEKNVVVTNSNFGNNYAGDVTFRFRYDAAAKQMILIGFDYESYTRSGNENGLGESYNFLTGIKEETINFVNKNRNTNILYYKQSNKRTHFKRRRITFEKAAYDLNENGMGIPIEMKK